MKELQGRHWITMFVLGLPALVLLYLVTFPWLVILSQVKGIPPVPNVVWKTYGAPWNYFMTESPLSGPLNDYLYFCRHVTWLE